MLEEEMVRNKMNGEGELKKDENKEKGKVGGPVDYKSVDVENMRRILVENGKGDGEEKEN
jgi:hypothetical protein